AMFSALEAAGVPRSELVLAWDFVTASDAFLRSDLQTMRQAALAALSPDAASVTFTTTPQPNTPQTYRKYTGTFKSPSFLTDGDADPSIMRRDAQGLPVLSGTYDARFAAIVPACMQSQTGPRPVI